MVELDAAMCKELLNEEAQNSTEYALDAHNRGITKIASLEGVS